MANSIIKNLPSLIEQGMYNGISGSYDFNDFVRPGYYNIRNSAKIANAPYTTANDYGVLLVLSVNNYIAQIFIPGTSSVKAYKRVYVDTAWNNWSDIMGGVRRHLLLSAMPLGWRHEEYHQSTKFVHKVGVERKLNDYYDNPIHLNKTSISGLVDPRQYAVSGDCQFRQRKLCCRYEDDLRSELRSIYERNDSDLNVWRSYLGRSNSAEQVAFYTGLTVKEVA